MFIDLFLKCLMITYFSIVFWTQFTFFWSKIIITWTTLITFFSTVITKIIFVGCSPLSSILNRPKLLSRHLDFLLLCLESPVFSQLISFQCKPSPTAAFNLPPIMVLHKLNDFSTTFRVFATSVLSVLYM